MGSWSVSCGISQISITSGNECCILPLKKSRFDSYKEYTPATLPIFGIYNDYGGLEDIVKDKTTELIENHFGVSIEEFVTFLVDGKYTYDRSEAKDVKVKLEDNETLEECEEWRFMWIDKQVYDYMTIFNDEWYKGHNDYGKPEFLKLFGFEKVKESDMFTNYDPKRFNQLWENKDGVKFYSDGHTLLSGTNQYVYNFGHGNESSLETYFDVPEEFHYLKEKSEYEVWNLMNKDDAMETLGAVLGFRMDSLINTRRFLKFAKSKGIDVSDMDEMDELDPKTILEKFVYNLEIFGDDLAKLKNLNGNLYPMSGTYRPHDLYLTPQCGEYERHQKILDKFAEINKSYLSKYD
jgi:hypothetical protein